VTWHTAWLNGGLEGSFHWIGDARRESALPIHCCGEVISRYERLAESFPAADEAERAVEPLALCGQEAFALAADRKELGPLPAHGQAGGLQQTPVRSAGSELLFYYDKPGDCYIIARQLPQTDDPSEISAAIDRYEDEILWLLSDEALSGGVDAETTPTEVRWIIPVPPRADEDEA